MRATGNMQVIKLAGLLKAQISQNKKAKGMISDAFMLFGQAKFNLSLRRRYITPFLKKKYASLCNNELKRPVKQVATCEAGGKA